MNSDTPNLENIIVESCLVKDIAHHRTRFRKWSTRALFLVSRIPKKVKPGHQDGFCWFQERKGPCGRCCIPQGKVQLCRSKYHSD